MRNFSIISAFISLLSIPVIANGGARTRSDAEAMLRATGAACCMAANGLLANVQMFEGGDDAKNNIFA